MVAPCKNCQDRHIKCHCNCKKYIQFKNNVNLINKKIRKDKMYIFNTARYG